jgi:hypothetical protein
VSNNVTESEFLAARISQMEGKKEATPEATPEAEESEGDLAEVKEEAQSEEAKPETESADAKVLSKIDLEQLSEAEIQELAKAARSKAISRFGELTSTIKELKAELEKSRAVTAQQQQAKPDFSAPPKVPEAIAKLDSVEAIKAKHEEANQVSEWAESVLDANEHLGSEDVVATIDGKELTKAQVKAYFKEAKRTKEQYLPAQYAEIQARQQRAALRGAMAQKAVQELDWLKGEDNDLKKLLAAELSSPLVDRIKKAVPEAEPMLDYVIAHAVNSTHGRKYHSLTGDEKAKPSVKLTPPSAVKTAAAGRGDEMLGKSITEATKRYETSRSETDFLALRTAQRAKRTR